MRDASDADPWLGPDERWTPVLDGAARVIQRARGGYRLSIDALLLAHWCRDVAGRALDLGTGSGVIALALATLGRCDEVVALEHQPALADRARRAALARAQATPAAAARAPVRVVEADARDVARAPGQAAAFDLVVSNPPYYKEGEGGVSADAERAAARHERTLTLDALLDAARRLLRPRGTLGLIYPAARLAELLAGLRARGLEPRALCCVHPAPGRPARVALVRSVRGAQPGLEVCAPLVVRPTGAVGNARDAYTPEVDAILRGAPSAWQTTRR